MKRMLWIDMEGSAVTTRTLDIYSKLLESHKNVGVALQAYLRRSEADLRQPDGHRRQGPTREGGLQGASGRGLPLARGGHAELPQAHEDALRESASTSPSGPTTPGRSRRRRGSTGRAPARSSSSRC